MLEYKVTNRGQNDKLRHESNLDDFASDLTVRHVYNTNPRDIRFSS